AGVVRRVDFDREPCGEAITVPAGSGGLLASDFYSSVGVTFDAGVIFPGGSFVTSPPNVVSNSQINTPTPALVDGTFAGPVHAVGIRNVGAQAVLRVFDAGANLLRSITTDTTPLSPGSIGIASDFVGIISPTAIQRFQYDFVSGIGFGGDDLVFTLTQRVDCTAPALKVPGTIMVDA